MFFSIFLSNEINCINLKHHKFQCIATALQTKFCKKNAITLYNNNNNNNNNSIFED
jgi:hypothetical protein